MGYYRRGLLGHVCPLGGSRLIYEEEDGTLRVCMDYMELNKIAKKKKILYLNIDLFDQLQEVGVFLKINLRPNYH